MKMPLNVGGKTYQMTLPDSLPDRKIEHPFGYAVKYPTMNENYLNIIYKMCEKLPKGQDVTCLMGGIGMFPLVYWDLLQPKSWTSVEIDPECEACFQEPRAKFICADAYDYKGLGNIVFVDMPNGTIRTIAENMDGRRRMWENIKRERPDHVMVTDHGYYWIHLPNHHPWYIEHFGEKPTRERYAYYWDKWMRDNMGYTVTEERHGSSSQYFHMEPI